MRIGAAALLPDAAPALGKCLASKACAATFLGGGAGSGTGHACCDASRCLITLASQRYVNEWMDGWDSRGAVAQLASCTQRRYPASVPGRIADECVETGFVAWGEGATLELLERWRRCVSQCLRRIHGTFMPVWEYMIFTKLLVAATSDR